MPPIVTLFEKWVKTAAHNTVTRLMDSGSRADDEIQQLDHSEFQHLLELPVSRPTSPVPRETFRPLNTRKIRRRPRGFSAVMITHKNEKTQ